MKVLLSLYQVIQDSNNPKSRLSDEQSVLLAKLLQSTDDFDIVAPCLELYSSSLIHLNMSSHFKSKDAQAIFERHLNVLNEENVEDRAVLLTLQCIANMFNHTEA